MKQGFAQICMHGNSFLHVQIIVPVGGWFLMLGLGFHHLSHAVVEAFAMSFLCANVDGFLHVGRDFLGSEEFH